MNGIICAIGTNHNVPMGDPIKTAERISSLVDGPISVGYDESWIFNPTCNSIVRSNEHKWIEMERINFGKPGPVTFFSIYGYCASKIYTTLVDIMDSVEFVNKKERDWFISDATGENDQFYRCYCPKKLFFKLLIFKKLIEFHDEIPSVSFQYVRNLENIQDKPNKDILEFRQHVFRKLKACGCDEVYFPNRVLKIDKIIE
ncbi:MAG: hypothetical protein K2J10_08970 [Muribaculaceae bacterium]|nr:hypothetical protein [Muribaculaceae bacterium]